jgi:hypothetical protein
MHAGLTLLNPRVDKTTSSRAQKLASSVIAELSAVTVRTAAGDEPLISQDFWDRPVSVGKVTKMRDLFSLGNSVIKDSVSFITLLNLQNLLDLTIRAAPILNVHIYYLGAAQVGAFHILEEILRGARIRATWSFIGIGLENWDLPGQTVKGDYRSIVPNFSGQVFVYSDMDFSKALNPQKCTDEIIALLLWCPVNADVRFKMNGPIPWRVFERLDADLQRLGVGFTVQSVGYPHGRAVASPEIEVYGSLYVPTAGAAIPYQSSFLAFTGYATDAALKRIYYGIIAGHSVTGTWNRFGYGKQLVASVALVRRDIQYTFELAGTMADTVRVYRHDGFGLARVRLSWNMPMFAFARALIHLTNGQATVIDPTDRLIDVIMQGSGKGVSTPVDGYSAYLMRDRNAILASRVRWTILWIFLMMEGDFANLGIRAVADVGCGRARKEYMSILAAWLPYTGYDPLTLPGHTPDNKIEFLQQPFAYLLHPRIDVIHIFSNSLQSVVQSERDKGNVNITALDILDVFAANTYYIAQVVLLPGQGSEGSQYYDFSTADATCTLKGSGYPREPCVPVADFTNWLNARPHVTVYNVMKFGELLWGGVAAGIGAFEASLAAIHVVIVTNLRAPVGRLGITATQQEMMTPPRISYSLTALHTGLTRYNDYFSRRLTTILS